MTVAASPARSTAWTLKRAHRVNAMVLGAFIAPHLLNHLVMLIGIDAHIAVMDAMRAVYRQPAVEIALLGLVVAQLGLGAALAYRRWRPRGFWGWAQVASGTYLFLFLAQHVGAIVRARLAFPDLDTNFYFAASVASVPPFSYYFVPYYFFGVLALFTHVGCAVRFHRWRSEPHRRAGIGLIATGALAGIVITSGLVGLIEPFDLPQPHQDYLVDGY